MSRYLAAAHRVFVAAPACSPGRDAITIALPDDDDASMRLTVARFRRARTAVGAGLSSPQATSPVVPYNSRAGRVANIREAVSRHEKGLVAARADVATSDGRALVSQLGKRLHQARLELADLQRTPDPVVA